uniref:Putative hydroxypyruvate isomerase n=1 Tax=Triatoma infestans TaxID=30076 RepID=A0A023F2Q4_TRIIF
MTLKFCANLSFMFQEAPILLDRYNLAKRAGFKAVECANPYNFPLEEIVKIKEDAALKQILINTPIDVVNKQLGYAALGPDYNNKFVQGIDIAIDYARALKCSIVHIMSGIVQCPTVSNRNYLIENLKYVKPLFENANLTCVIEAINPYSFPNYYLNSYDTALEIVKEINSPRIRLLLDIFHLQRTKGDLTVSIEKLLPYTSHIQIAQVPGRHEPNTAGEIDYKYILCLLERLSYKGYVGLEYNPAGDTVSGLDWITQFGYTLDH